MKKNGFTLIELLAVIALLALIMLIIIPPMISQVQKVRRDLSDSQTKLIYSAAETYIKKNKNDYPTKEGNKYCLSLQMLVNEGLLQDNLVDQLTDAQISLEMTIEATVDSKVSYTFEFDPDKKVCTIS